jgi:hypothetical protein
MELRDPPCLKTPIPHSNPQILNTYKEILINNKIRLFLDVWWFNNPAPVDLSGPPRLKTPIPHSNPRIKKNHKRIWVQNEIRLILDVWWFNNPALVNLWVPHAWNPQFHLQTLELKIPTKKLKSKMRMGYF